MKYSSFSQHLEAKKNKISVEDKQLYKEKIEKYNNHLDSISKNLYEKLNPSEQERLATWFMKRWLSIDIVKSHEKKEYLKKIKEIASQETKKITFNNKEYHILNLKKANLKGQLTTYKWNFCIHDFHYKQYQNENIKKLEKPIIIDAGAFVGDTALLFDQIHTNPTIHSFELLDENIKLLNKNIIDNELKNIKIFKTALSNKDNETVYINAPAVQGATSMFGKSSGEAIQTTTIDQHMKCESLPRVDLIKMDIEGAEKHALLGAKDTIKTHKPILAICIYHLWDDIIQIPKIINEINPDYKFSFNWVELNNGWEAVLFAFEHIE